jgi:hypothetical protein
MSDIAFKSWHLAAPPSRTFELSALRATIVKVGALGLLAAIFGALALAAIPKPAPLPTPVENAVVAAPVEHWIEIRKPVQIFSLQAPELRGLPLAYAARRHSVAGGREDTLAFGTLADGGSALRLGLFRRADEKAVSVPFYASIASQAADAGLGIERSGLPDLVVTRFGRMEVADVALSGKGRSQSCHGFRLSLTGPALSMTGFACAPATKPMSRATLGCLIERLDLASAREDRALIDVFAASELHRNAACEGMRLGPDSVHAAWLDDKPATLAKRIRRR